MRWLVLTCALGTLAGGFRAVAAESALPFQHKVEVYRSEEGEMVFALRLEQPFFVEFEKSNYIRLTSGDERAYLIYPKETTFQQKHAEFYGRLRGEGAVRVKLTYEFVSENLDGSRRVDVRKGEIEVPIPTGETGPKSIYLDWAREQNLHFAHLLRYYPEETFFQYCLLQSQARYGVKPPPIPKDMPAADSLETYLYQVFTGSMAIQESLQRETLSTSGQPGDLSTHISSLRPPSLRSLPYKELLEKKKTEEGAEPNVHELARLVPEDQYLLQFNSMESMGQLLDLWSQWGDSLLRLYTVRAQDQRLEAKLEDQLCLRRGPITQLFADQVIHEVVISGTDPFVMEGTDVTVIFRLKNAEVFRTAAAGWLGEVRERYPGVVDREFNYRGHKVAVHYTEDRMVSSFAVEHEDAIVYSNSHRAIRRVIDTAVGVAPSLYDGLDYRYVSTILPPAATPQSGYFFASEPMIKRLVGPEAKISEKRRLQCFNNLVMLNNASLFYRLEFGRSPKTLSDLIEGRFVDPAKIVCPHGGAYALDAERDTCTCSLHNRLKYLTPNAELSVLNVSKAEAEQYERYKQRYRAFWQGVFDPVAIRITVGPRVKLESCILPFANGSLYQDLRGNLAKNTRPIGTARIAPSAVSSLVAVPGRENIGQFLREVPGVAEALKANPTLTDLSWIGDSAGLHFCDGESILQIDPAAMRTHNLPMLGNVPLSTQIFAASAIGALNMPIYVTVDVENREKASQLLEQLAQEIFLKRESVFGLAATLDGYRLPDYKQHAIYVFSGQLYAVKIHLHVALVGDQLVAATKPEILREVIDAAGAEETRPPIPAHMLLRFNRSALDDLYDDLQLHWAEKSRVACHRNIISIYNLCRLYDVPIDDVWRLSETKYGVRYFCPDQGEYAFDAERSQVVCSVHGNREHSRQNPGLDRKSSFARFIESLDEIIASLRFQDEALIATVEIVRSGAEP
jgi:hypothetical protein